MSKNDEKKNSINENESEVSKEKKDSHEKNSENEIVDELLKLNSDLKLSNEKLEKAEKERDELKDSLLRKAAEFENYKRRKETETENLLKYAAEPFITKMISVYDDLSRSLDHASKAKNTESITEGIKMVYNKFSKILEEQGIAKINAKGEPFDFNYHEALMQQVSDDVPPHTVLEEIEPGYMYKDRVLKHSKVIVSQQSVENSAPEEKKDTEDKNEEN